MHAIINLTSREIQVLKLISEGNTDKQIAALLGLSDKTVSTHRKHMLKKLQVSNTALLIRYAMEKRIVK